VVCVIGCLVISGVYGGGVNMCDGSVFGLDVGFVGVV